MTRVTRAFAIIGLGFATMVSAQKSPSMPSPSSSPQPDRVPLDSEQRMEFRLLSSEMQLIQAVRAKAESDEKLLGYERDSWIARAEASHPGYKLIMDGEGVYLKRLDSSPASAPVKP